MLMQINQRLGLY